MNLKIKETVGKLLAETKKRTVLTKTYKFENLAQYTGGGAYYRYINGVKTKAGLPTNSTILAASMAGWGGLGAAPNVQLANDDGIWVMFPNGHTLTASSYVTMRFVYMVGE